MAPQFDKMLVLDLDETLIHSVCFGFEKEYPHRGADFHVDGGDIGVYRRPGVGPFLAWALEHFKAVGIWTAGTLDYAQEIIPHLCAPKALRRRFPLVETQASGSLLLGQFQQQFIDGHVPGARGGRIDQEADFHML